MKEVSGILSVVKPPLWTSMEVVRQVKRLTRQKKVGHGGTLDPQATGVLPICFGQATRVMDYLIEGTKVYRALAQLGVSTDTYDSQGRITEVKDPSHITQEDVAQALEAFRGVIYQTPPMYSALKLDGERLYNLAREGKEVQRVPRKVEVNRLEITQWNPPEVELEIECGRGVYVRSLADDLGAALGCGAHLKALTRLRAGPLGISTASTMAQLEEACKDSSWQSLLFPLDIAFLNLKASIIQKEKEASVRQGQAIYMGLPFKTSSANGQCRLYSVDGDFVAILRPDKVRGLWRPHKVFDLRSSS